ncbi:MAG: hypothetical protein J6V32_03115 [Elusimicrobiaceae bacterium]|nr:hypothetical protein [Elusimicrobiaceae bacterium]
MRRPQDVRRAQLMAANLLKFENIPVSFILNALKSFTYEYPLGRHPELT